MAEQEIRIDNARSHNLRGVSCAIPLNAITVISGVSGSGKSTLAFDTLYAEGQRRYVTSLSTYARQFLERMARPEVDAISNLPPAIAIEQRNRVSNARSTVGTASEILDHLRLLFAKIGETRCPDCELPAVPGGVSAVSERVLERFEGKRLIVAAPLVAEKKETFAARRERLLRDGHGRLIDAEGQIVELIDLSGRALKALWDDSLLLIDRLVPKPGGERMRLVEAIAAAFRCGRGRLTVMEPGGERQTYREGFACDGCGREFLTPSPALFSFNSPLGACEACSGFGRTAELDWERVIPDPSLSIEDDAIVPFATPMGRSMLDDLLAACEEHGIDPSMPFEDLSDAHRELVLEGDEADDGEWYGVRGYFDWLEGRRYRVQARTTIARYRKFERCDACAGTRLREDALWVHVGGRDIASLCRIAIRELRDWAQKLVLDDAQEARGARLLELLRARLATVDEVGLGYITLDRQLRTLSGGEAQRIQLASALGGSLTSVLYVLDEPSIGLHPRDMDRLLAVMRTIRDQGNTLVVVEHAPEIIGAADYLIDMGPGAGRNGGRIVASGSVAAVRESEVSQTARALRGEFASPSGREAEGREREGKGEGDAAPQSLRIIGARANNLQNIDVAFPLGRLVVVTGVSGAGKSTLVYAGLVANLVAALPRATPGHIVPRGLERGECDRIEGASRIKRVVVVDQSPASRSPRSNSATVSKAFDGIRRVFAQTREARIEGWGPGFFSFNVAGGRCDVCEGSGQVVIDMQFLDDVEVPCDSCGGLRYRREVLQIRHRGRSIADVLALSIQEAMEVFEDQPAIVKALQPLDRVGLGYLALGQPLSTLSGGEHQRMRLALALAEGAAETLYVLDEPTTGLHSADVAVLLGCLEALIASGGSVIVVEHNLDVIRRADHVIDIGPEGGPEGGRVVALGLPHEVATVEGSHTGVALARVLNP